MNGNKMKALSIIKRRTSIFILFGIILFAIVYYTGSIANPSNHELEGEKSTTPNLNPITQSPIPTTISQVTVITNTQTKNSVSPPDQYGFTNNIELKGIGFKAKFPRGVNVSLQEQYLYIVKASETDAVSFSLKDYDGGGRRAWFQKEYPWTKNYTLEPYTAKDHNGYIAYAVKPEELPGPYFYFAVINNKMLIVSGNNYASNNLSPNQRNNSVFFSADIKKFKSFLSAIELITPENVIPESNPQISEVFRISLTRKTLWEDTSLGLKITAPEWIETRYTNGRDISGKYIYTEWARVNPEAKINDGISPGDNISPNSPEILRSIEVSYATGYLSKFLNILSSKYNGKAPEELISTFLLTAGFCSQEWKNSKTDCARPDFCYTRDEVVRNIIIKRQTYIGALDAKLISMNQEFSNQNDCRSEDIWLIKAKNGQLVLSTIFPDNEAAKLEAN